MQDYTWHALLLSSFPVWSTLLSMVELRALWINKIQSIHLSVTHLRFFHCFCVVEQATLLEESGDPEKALDELLKKEAKIVLHPALLFCNQPFLLVSVELLLHTVVCCHLRLGCLTSQAFSSLN